MTTRDEARAKAVSLHEASVEKFVTKYGHRGHDRMTAFLYGRLRIDPYLETVVSALPSGATVLDAGCGTGEQLQAMRERGFRATGIEPAKRMREQALQRVPAEAVVDASVLALPFSDNHFDLVYSLEVFRYLTAEDNLAGFREIHRVLKPGGTFFGTFVNRYAADGFSLVVLSRRLADKFGKPINCHTTLDTPAVLRRRLQDAGFTSAVTHGAMFAPLRIVWKLAGSRLSTRLSQYLSRYDAALCDGAFSQRMAGHLIAVAQK